MSTNIFINLPVKDLEASVAFFTRLGFTFNPQFTDHNATCMIISENIFVMLLVESYFKSFTKKDIPDTSQAAQVILCLSAGNRTQVDEMVKNAVEAGGTIPNAKQDHGWMYTHGFQDLDGHLWEIAYMDQAALSQA